MSAGGSDDYTVPADLQGGRSEIGGAEIAGMPVVTDPLMESGTVAMIPEGCAALWHAEASVVDPKAILEQAALAAHRTHKDQAVLLPDGTVRVISGEVFGGVVTF